MVECNLPVLLTVMDTANRPRPPAAKRMMKYKKARRAGPEIAKAVEDNAEAADARGQGRRGRGPAPRN